MPGAPVIDDLELVIEDRAGGGGGEPPAGGGDDDGERSRRPGAPTPRRYTTGVMLGIFAILMFFMALVSAYIVRKGSPGNDWVPIAMPPILWVNTVILLVSSLTLELARRRLAQADPSGFQTLWLVTTGLGLLFLAGQLLAWRQLVAAGAYLSSNPSNSFFYVLTAAHGVHLLGGILALLYVTLRRFAGAQVTRAFAAEVTSYYWHFMDGLWVFLLAILYLGR